MRLQTGRSGIGCRRDRIGVVAVMLSTKGLVVDAARRQGGRRVAELDARRYRREVPRCTERRGAGGVPDVNYILASARSSARRRASSLPASFRARPGCVSGHGSSWGSSSMARLTCAIRRRHASPRGPHLGVVVEDGVVQCGGAYFIRHLRPARLCRAAQPAA